MLSGAERLTHRASPKRPMADAAASARRLLAAARSAGRRVVTMRTSADTGTTPSTVPVERPRGARQGRSGAQRWTGSPPPRSRTIAAR
ncbi:MAG: hypothetical protein WC580_01995, partial [Agrococcus sp.]